MSLPGRRPGGLGGWFGLARPPAVRATIRELPQCRNGRRRWTPKRSPVAIGPRESIQPRAPAASPFSIPSQVVRPQAVGLCPPVSPSPSRFPRRRKMSRRADRFDVSARPAARPRHGLHVCRFFLAGFHLGRRKLTVAAQVHRRAAQYLLAVVRHQPDPQFERSIRRGVRRQAAVGIRTKCRCRLIWPSRRAHRWQSPNVPVAVPSRGRPDREPTATADRETRRSLPASVTGSTCDQARVDHSPIVQLHLAAEHDRGGRLADDLNLRRGWLDFLRRLSRFVRRLILERRHRRGDSSRAAARPVVRPTNRRRAPRRLVRWVA